MNKDEIEGTADKMIGAAQEAIGGAIGDDKLEAKGLLNQASGLVQSSYGKVREKITDLVEDAPPVVKDAVDTGRDYYQRGSAAVTRTMGDNTALTLLAAGAAGAALSWLLFGRRGGKPEE